MPSQPEAKSIYNQNSTLFISAVTHAGLYSFSVALFIGCLFVQRYQVNKDLGHLLITLFLWLMFILSTILVIAHLHFFRLVLVVHVDNPGYAGILNTSLHIITNLLEGVGAAVADSLMIWRCYILWGRNRAIIALPSLMALATFAMAIEFAVQYGRNNPDGILKSSIALVSISVATNIIVTILISSRIISYTRQSSLNRKEKAPYKTIIGIIIESAALYAASGIVLTATNALGHPSEQIAVSIYMLMPSITAYMIILRVGLGLQFGFAEEKKDSLIVFDHDTGRVTFDFGLRTARSTTQDDKDVSSPTQTKRHPDISTQGKSAVTSFNETNSFMVDTIIV